MPIYDIIVRKSAGYPKVLIMFNISDEPRFSGILSEMEEWCKDNECGYRKSFAQFKFKTPEEMMLFILRWSGCQ